MTASDLEAPSPQLDPVLALSGYRRVRGLSIALGNAAAALLVVLAAPGWLLGGAVQAEIWRGGVVAVPLAALMVALAALLGTLVVTAARLRAARDPAAERDLGRAARWPQTFLVPALSL